MRVGIWQIGKVDDAYLQLIVKFTTVVPFDFAFNP